MIPTQIWLVYIEPVLQKWAKVSIAISFIANPNTSEQGQLKSIATFATAATLIAMLYQWYIGTYVAL